MELPEAPDERACEPFWVVDTRGERVRVISVEFLDYVFALWSYTNDLRESVTKSVPTGSEPKA